MTVRTEQDAPLGLTSYFVQRPATSDEMRDTECLLSGVRVVEVQTGWPVLVTPPTAVTLAFVLSGPRPATRSRRPIRVRTTVRPVVFCPVTVRTEHDTVAHLSTDPRFPVAVVHQRRDVLRLFRVVDVVEVQTRRVFLTTHLTLAVVELVRPEPLADRPSPAVLAVDPVATVLVVPSLLWREVGPLVSSGSSTSSGFGWIDPSRPSRWVYVGRSACSFAAFQLQNSRRIVDDEGVTSSASYCAFVGDSPSRSAASRNARRHSGSSVISRLAAPSRFRARPPPRAREKHTCRSG